MEKIKVAIVGYGNLGKACERIIYSGDLFECIGVFTRRNPIDVSSPYGSKIYFQDEIYNFVDKIDVVVLCLGSKGDLMPFALKIAPYFNTVDSFDTHAKMNGYYNEIRHLTEQNARLAFIGIGWDPGLFSLMRALFSSMFAGGSIQTFWGKGVSQGHSEAIRRIDGVVDAKQYTIPIESALKLAREGRADNLTPRDKHKRECFVVAKDGADTYEIERKIKTMPNYFADYDTTVHFVDEKTLHDEHSGLSHAGVVIGHTNEIGKSVGAEFRLELESNPDFTATVLMTYAKVNYKMRKSGEIGVRTILDIPISQLCDMSVDEMIEKYV